MTTTTLSLRVLYLEDNAVDADLARRELARLAPEMQLTVATTLHDALEKLAPAPPPFDIVLSDLNLPDGNGMELLAHVRERGLPLPVVVITGAGDQDTVVAVLKAGADDYLAKSADYLQNLPRVLANAQVASHTRRISQARPMRVLYAEANESDVALIRRHLVRHAPNIQLEVVGSGAETLARLPAGTTPRCDVLMLDCRLPDMLALDVVKALRRERRSELPVLLVTGEGSEELALQAMQLGVDDYLIKRGGYLQSLPVILEKLQKQTELQQRESEFRRLSRQFNGVLDAIPDGIMLLDLDLKMVWLNRAAATRTGIPAEEMIGRFCYLWDRRTTPCLLCPVLKCLETGAPMAETLTTGDKRTWDVRAVPLLDDRGTVTNVIVLKRDITEHRQLERQYLHAQKMESLGVLASGVAHDFNNLLTAQFGYCDLMKRQLSDEDPLSDEVEMIRSYAERAAALTRQLLAFSRKQTLHAVVLDLNTVITNVGKMLKRLLGENIELVTHLADRVGQVKIDPGNLEQVIVNLAVNARDAMPRGGVLTIGTADAELDGAFPQQHGDAATGPHVMMTVSDTGCGMDDETQSRLFEPFFTTKGPGKGTGLGLATVYGIVKQSGGSIWVKSEPGYGTTFKIYLPRIEAEPSQDARRATRPPEGQGELVLVVEDEQFLRELSARMLERLGYRVAATAGGDEALAAVAREGLRPDLLFTDMIMPGMSGKELAEQLRRLLPGLRVLYTSGYADNDTAYLGELDPGIAFLEKPFNLVQLAAKIREALGSD